MNRWEVRRRLNEQKGYSPYDLAGIKELSEDVFHVARTVVSSWNMRRMESDYFPPPVKDLGGGPIFSISEYIVAWNDWEPKRGTKSGTLSEGYQECLKLWLQEIEEEEAKNE